ECLVETNHPEVLVGLPIHHARVFGESGRCAVRSANQRPVGDGVKRQVRQDRRRNRDRRLARKNAAPGVVVENGSDLRDPLVLAKSLVAAEEERPVLQNRAAKRPTELIPTEVRLLVVEVVLAVKLVIAEELECRSGEQVRTRLGDDVEYATAGATVLGAHRV